MRAGMYFVSKNDTIKIVSIICDQKKKKTTVSNYARKTLRETGQHCFIILSMKLTTNCLHSKNYCNSKYHIEQIW